MRIACPRYRMPPASTHPAARSATSTARAQVDAPVEQRTHRALHDGGERRTVGEDGGDDVADAVGDLRQLPAHSGGTVEHDGVDLHVDELERGVDAGHPRPDHDHVV